MICIFVSHKAHKARYQVSSLTGKGNTFCFKLLHQFSFDVLYYFLCKKQNPDNTLFLFSAFYFFLIPISFRWHTELCCTNFDATWLHGCMIRFPALFFTPCTTASNMLFAFFSCQLNFDCILTLAPGKFSRKRPTFPDGQKPIQNKSAYKHGSSSLTYCLLLPSFLLPAIYKHCFIHLFSVQW